MTKEKSKGDIFVDDVFESRNDLGDFLDSYRQIAVALNRFPENEMVSVSRLATLASVHWSTAKKALLFFDKIRVVIPEFEILEDLKFKIIAKSSAFKAVKAIFASSEMRVLTKMMLCRAMDAESARSLKEVLDPQELEVLPKLISTGFVNSIDGLYYLSRRGTSIGGLGLKKLVNSGIQLPWQRTSTALSVSSTPPKIQGEMKFEVPANPIYPQRLYGNTTTDYLEEWNTSF